MPMHLRLCEIYEDIGTLVDTFHHPDEVAIEELFFSKTLRLASRSRRQEA